MTYLCCYACVPPGFYICSPRLMYWLLIMATATLIMFAPCASGSTWKCLLSCQVLPFGCMRQTTWLSGRQTDETRGQRNRIFEGWACYNAVAYWLQTKQTNKSNERALLECILCKIGITHCMLYFDCDTGQGHNQLVLMTQMKGV